MAQRRTRPTCRNTTDIIPLPQDVRGREVGVVVGLAGLPQRYVKALDASGGARHWLATGRVL